MKLLNLLIPLFASAAFCASCDDGELELDQSTATVRFVSAHVEIEQTSDEQTSLMVLASKGSMLNAYKIYIAVEDPKAWIGDVCTIANPVYKEPDRENGDHRIIYTANMGEGMLKTALLITAGVHSSEDIDRELRFEIIEDPLKASYPNGSPYYKADKNQGMTTVLLKKMEP